MEPKSYTIEELSRIADEVIDFLRHKNVSIGDVRTILKYAEDALEFEPLALKEESRAK